MRSRLFAPSSTICFDADFPLRHGLVRRRQTTRDDRAGSGRIGNPEPEPKRFFFGAMLVCGRNGCLSSQTVPMILRLPKNYFRHNRISALRESSMRSCGACPRRYLVSPSVWRCRVPGRAGQIRLEGFPSYHPVSGLVEIPWSSRHRQARHRDASGFSGRHRHPPL